MSAGNCRDADLPAGGRLISFDTGQPEDGQDERQTPLTSQPAPVTSPEDDLLLELGEEARDAADSAPTHRGQSGTRGSRGCIVSVITVRLVTVMFVRRRP